MCIVYTSFALMWLFFSSLNYTDLLRIQFWIGGVIFVGMIEKAVKFAEYDNVNKNGNSIAGAEKFAEAVSAFKVIKLFKNVQFFKFNFSAPRQECSS